MGIVITEWNVNLRFKSNKLLLLFKFKGYYIYKFKKKIIKPNVFD